MKIPFIAIFIAVLVKKELNALTVGGRFIRETESDSHQDKPNEQATINGSQPDSTYNQNITTAPTVLSVEKTPLENNEKPSPVSPSNDLEADNFIESLKKKAEGVEPKNKNETRFNFNDSLLKISSINETDNTKNATDSNKNASAVVLTQSISPLLISNESDTKVVALNESTTPILPTTATPTNSTNNTLEVPEIKKISNDSCPAECSADSCKPDCSFHCCLKEKDTSQNESMGGFYQEGNHGTSGSIEFDSSKLEKMLLDTISEFSQKLPTTSQTTQKLSDIAGDPSKHYQYAPNYDTQSNNGYNLYNQYQNSYYNSDVNSYLNGGYPSNSYLNSYNTPNNYNNIPSNQQISQKSTINPSYKRSYINYPKTPIASGFRTSYHHVPTNEANYGTYAYNNRNYAPRQSKIFKRSRIYSPYASPTYV